MFLYDAMIYFHLVIDLNSDLYFIRWSISSISFIQCFEPIKWIIKKKLYVINDKVRTW